MLHFLTEHFGRLWAIGALPIVLPIVLYGWHLRQIAIRHPSLKPHQGKLRSFSVLLLASYIALSGVVTTANVVVMQPREPAGIVQHLAKKRNVCMAGDRSGSMTSVLEENFKELADDEAKAKNDPKAKVVNNGGSDKTIVQAPTGQPVPDEEMVPGKATRVDGMYLAMRYLLRHRMSDNPDETDRFCIFTFDTDTYVMAPLSTDKRVLILRTVHLKENVGGGTNFFGPNRSDTGIGPLQKALDFFQKYTGEDSVNVEIIITDGYDSGDPMRIQQLLAQFQQRKVHLYIIGLGDGWKEGNNLDLQKFANALHQLDPNNGIVFVAQNPGQMDAAMETINRLEKKQEVIVSVQTYQETPFWWIVSCGGFAVAFVLLAAAARRVP
jgi:hypothetical protein